MSSLNQETDLLLLLRIREGKDDKAKEELIHKYMPMVRHIIKKQGFHHLEYDDLFQEGLIGLLRAVTKYDRINYEIKFSTFAYICILRKISNILKQYRSKKRCFYETFSLFEQKNSIEAKALIEMIADSSFDPEMMLMEKINSLRLQEVLRAHLSIIEYSVLLLYLQGLSYGEVQNRLGLKAKVVDNARTRARLKLQRIVEKYGSLLNSKVPLTTRRREDLSLRLKVI